MLLAVDFGCCFDGDNLGCCAVLDCSFAGVFCGSAISGELALWIFGVLKEHWEACGLNDCLMVYMYMYWVCGLKSCNSGCNNVKFCFGLGVRISWRNPQLYADFYTPALIIDKSKSTIFSLAKVSFLF